MNRILILDTETTGLDPAVDKTIEIGAILYSVEHGTPLGSFASLLRADANAAEHVNRIPAAAIREEQDPQLAWEVVEAMALKADAIVAHRAEFDRGFVSPALRDGHDWICSKFDIEWPKGQPGASLVQLALDHDLGVAYAHRALTDCDLLARLFTRCRELGSDIDLMLTRAQRPKADYVALVSYDDREMAKKAAFQWDGAAKLWKRRMFIEEAAKLPFKVREVRA